MDFKEIKDPNIREAMKFIHREYHDERDVYNHALIYQLIRLSRENKAIMIGQRAMTPFDYHGHMRMMCNVADFPMEKQHDGADVSLENTRSLMDLVSNLLAASI